MPTKPRFTDRIVRSLTADERQTTYWSEDLSGFGVRVTPTGTRSFVVRYRANGTRRRYTIGRYGKISLADARAKAKEIMARVELGEDPAAERERSRGATFREVARNHLQAATGSRFSETHADRIRRAFENDVYPAIGARPISEVSRRDVAEILEGVVARGSPVMANRLKSMMSGVFEYAFERELVDTNPAKAVRRPAKESGRERVLTPAEIRELWAALEGEPPLAVGVVKLRLLTGQRGTEIRRMRHRDVHGDTWIQPAATTKTGKRHRVPLSRHALAVLAALEPHNDGSEWVFPSRRRDGPRGRPDKLLQKLRDKVSFEDFQLRDLRRTVATRMAEDLRVPRFVVAKVLGHRIPGITGVYDRASYEDEKREALEAWGDRLEEIVAGGENG